MMSLSAQQLQALEVLAAVGLGGAARLSFTVGGLRPAQQLSGDKPPSTLMEYHGRK